MKSASIEEHWQAIDIDLDEPWFELRALVDPRAIAAYRLRRGMSISEQPIDTLPGALQEELRVAETCSKYRSWMDEEDVNPFTGRR